MIFLALYMVVGIAIQILVRNEPENRWTMEHALQQLRHVASGLNNVHPILRMGILAAVGAGFAAASVVGVITWPIVIYRRLSPRDEDSD